MLVDDVPYSNLDPSGAAHTQPHLFSTKVRAESRHKPNSHCVYCTVLTTYWCLKSTIGVQQVRGFCRVGGDAVMTPKLGYNIRD